jgi:hypothetical protein
MSKLDYEAVTVLVPDAPDHTTKLISHGRTTEEDAFVELLFISCGDRRLHITCDAVWGLYRGFDARVSLADIVKALHEAFPSAVVESET